jgi:hypothetical protein
MTRLDRPLAEPLRCSVPLRYYSVPEWETGTGVRDLHPALRQPPVDAHCLQVRFASRHLSACVGSGQFDLFIARRNNECDTQLALSTPMKRHYQCGKFFFRDVLHFIDEDDQRRAGLLSRRPDCLQKSLQVLLEIPVVCKTSLWGKIDPNFDILILEFETLGKT